MSSAQSIVNKILLENDSESPEAYLKWLGAKRDEEARVDELVKAELGEISFGFAIHTSDEDTVQANAVEAGIDFEAVGDQLAHDFTQIERNAMRLLANSGFTLRGEGHSSDGALIGTCWLTDRVVLENILSVIYGPREWPSTSAGTMDGFFPYKDQHGRASATTALYAGVSEAGQRLIEVFIEFFDTDKLKDWAESHNLGESVEDEDAPESFIQHYAPRLNGRLFIDVCVVRPSFPQLYQQMGMYHSWIKEPVDGLPLFHHMRGTEVREALRQMREYNTHREGSAKIPMTTYRYCVPNPARDAIVREWLEKCRVPAAVISYVEQTNAPIWFYVSVKEFHAYIRMVYPKLRVKLGESGEDDIDPKTYLNQIHSYNDLKVGIQNYGLAIRDLEDFGKWYILNGFAYWRVYGDPERSVDEPFVREQVAKFLTEFGITQHRLHVKCSLNPWLVRFQLLVPKAQMQRGEFDNVFINRPVSDGIIEGADDGLDPKDYLMALPVPPQTPKAFCALARKDAFVDFRHAGNDTEYIDFDVYMEKIAPPDANGDHDTYGWHCSVCYPSELDYEDDGSVSTSDGTAAFVPNSRITVSGYFDINTVQYGWTWRAQEIPPDVLVKLVADFNEFIQRLRKATGTTLSSVTMENAPAGFNLTESAGEDDPALNIPRHTDAIHDETLQAAIDSALADFEHVVIQQNVGDSRRADELAGEITANWINNVGYDSELHPDECEAILTALYKRAGELFPLNWEDSEEPYPVDETKALPSETVLPESGTKPVEGETLRGIDLVKRLLQIGTAQGGFLNFTLKEIRQRNYRLTSVDVRELAKTDNSFADYADSGEKREYRGDLRSTEDSNVELPAVDLFDEPIVVIDGMVRDGWSRAAAHLKAGEFQVQAWVAEPVVPEAAKAITTELGAPVNEAQEDDDAVDPREYALSCPVFDREKLKKALAEAGWRYAFTRTLDTQWELGWDSTKVAHWGSTRDEQVYEGDRAAAEVEEIVKRVVPGACDFRFTNMLGHDRALSHFSLVFRIPPNVRVIHKLNHESQDADIDPAKYIDDTFDINAVMSRLCFVFSDQDNAWIKIYAGRPNNRPDAMIAVSVHGGAPDVDRTYDTIVYIAKEDRDYVPVAYRWSRLAKELPVVIGHLERKIRAGDDSQLRESAPDPNDLDDPEAVLRQQSKDLVDYTMKQLGFKGCGSADQVEGFTLWRNEYPGADGKKHWLLVSTCLAGGSPMYVRPMEPETNGWGDALTVHPKSPAHQALIIRDVDAAMQRSADDGLVGEAEVQALKRVLQHHGEVNKN